MPSNTASQETQETQATLRIQTLGQFHQGAVHHTRSSRGTVLPVSIVITIGKTDPKFFILYISVRCICLISQTSESYESGENLYIQDPCSVCGFLYPIWNLPI